MKKKIIAATLMASLILSLVACGSSSTKNESDTSTAAKTVTEAPAEETTSEPTEEATPEPTEEATPEPTEEATPEPTEEATPEPTEEATPEPTEEATPEPTEEPAQSDTGAIRDEVKAAIDSYEAFVDEYCDFMKSYDSSDLTMLSQYADLMQKAVDELEAFDAIEDEELNDAELAYYTEVSLRCSQKMLEAASEM